MAEQPLSQQAAEQAADVINPSGGGLAAEPAVDVPPGQGKIKDMPGDVAHLKNLGGDMGTVKGPGLGSVQGGIDARGGTDAPDVATQSDTSKLEGSPADVTPTQG